MIIKKIGSFPKGVKASIAFFLSSLVTKGIAFITTPIFTRLLTAEEFGQVSLYYTWYQLFGIIAMFCLCYAVFNVGMLDYPDKRDEYSFSLLILSNIITFCFAAILILLYPAIKSYLGLSLSLLLLMCVMYIFQPAYLFWVARERYEYKYKWVLVFAILSAVIAPVVSIVCITCNASGSDLYSRIFGFEAPLCLIHVLFYLHLGKKAKWKINTKYWKPVIMFNIPLIPHYLSSFLLNSSDRIMISYIVNDETTAYYSLAYSIASIALIIWTAIDNSLVPYTFEKMKVGEERDIRNVANPLILLFAFGCIAIICCAPEVVAFMGTSKYKEAIYVIPPIVGGVFFQVQYFLYSNILYYYKRPKYVMLGSLCAMSVNLVLNYFCINRFGFIAAGYTTLICYAIQAIIDYIAMRSVANNNIYDMRFIVALSLVVSLVACFTGLTYDSGLLRCIFILIYVLLLILFRKKIIKSFKLVLRKE